MTLVQLPKLNLTDEEIQYAIRRLGRDPNQVEWSMLEAQWSEHCSYKSSKHLLKLLPSKGRHVLVGPGYDAGVIDIGNDWAVTLHIESHNHPSAIDPYGGAATGVGGILRDILSLGTRPILLLDPLRFGSLKGSHSQWLFDNVVRGIADYGNCTGIPTVGGEVEFDESFERNCLVDVACVGLGREKELVLAEARHPGDLVILVGGNTGRDGIQGASFASKTLTEKSDSERSAVQVPDPFQKKLIIEAVLEAVNAGIIRGMKDLGGGGLTCGLSETATKGGTGIQVDLDKVHVREPNMNASEIMISESQERMLLVIQPRDEPKLASILEKYEVAYSRIGQVTEEKLLVIKKGNEVVARAPAKFVAEAPLARRPDRKPAYIDQLANVPNPSIPRDLSKTLISLLSSPNICSREWIYRQYDHEVGLRTIVRPGQGDSAVVRLPNSKTLSVTSDGNSKQAYLDPYWGTAGIVSKAMSNLVVTGATPVAVVDHLQFGDPGNPEVYWTFKQAIRAIRDYLTAVRVPCVGGKVSFYNEDSETGRAIKPSPVIAAIGLREKEISQVGPHLAREGDDLILVGTTLPEMGGSEYYETIYRVTGGKVPWVNLKKERMLLAAIAKIVTGRLVNGAHDVSKGGLAVALAKMAIKGQLGFTVNLDTVPAKQSRIDQLLFSETRARFVLESKPSKTAQIMANVKRAGAKTAVIGQVKANKMEFFSRQKPIISLSVEAASEAWSQTIPKTFEI
ncbi:MAG TPA: phosphoribosylformylglycinamidine synthase subunit PurL [Candidatus Bathyarchaeia archaeon]|nr:phosphoribosylformylglycinamidine synthase subunit PurL [Candidatus Bathyarchaeia archaeon]